MKEATENYEKAVEGENSGIRILAAFSAISRWLRYEMEFNDIETWRNARNLVFLITSNPNAYGLTNEDISIANDVGINIAKAHHEAGNIAKKHAGFFQSFIKDLGVRYSLNSEEKGDLIMILLILRLFVEDNEDYVVAQKYANDIESICKNHLEGDDIYDTSFELAGKIYSNNKV